LRPRTPHSAAAVHSWEANTSAVGS
jgi:hypothetical protein